MFSTTPHHKSIVELQQPKMASPICPRGCEEGRKIQQGFGFNPQAPTLKPKKGDTFFHVIWVVFYHPKERRSFLREKKVIFFHVLIKLEFCLKIRLTTKKSMLESENKIK